MYGLVVRSAITAVGRESVARIDSMGAQLGTLHANVVQVLIDESVPKMALELMTGMRDSKLKSRYSVRSLLVITTVLAISLAVFPVRALTQANLQRISGPETDDPKIQSRWRWIRRFGEWRLRTPTLS